MIRALISGVAGALAWYAGLVIVFGPAQLLLADPELQSPKMLAAFTDPAAPPRMAGAPWVLPAGLLGIGIGFALAYRLARPAFGKGRFGRGARFGLLAWILMVPWFAFYLPWNVLLEPGPLVLLEMACWFLVLQGVGQAIAWTQGDFNGVEMRVRTRTVLPLLAALPLCLSISSCGSAQRSRSFEELASPAGPGSQVPFLASAGDTLYLSWIERAEGAAPAVRFARWDGHAWGPARTIASGDELFVNWADFPSLLVLEDGTVVAHWLEKRAGGSHAYDVKIARSKDAGATFDPPVCPHRDGLSTEHGFVSLVDLGAGRFATVWLDGRNIRSETLPGGEERAAGEMQLLTATFEDGSFGPESVLDPRVCDCCQTAAAAIGEVVFAAYRDRSPSEVRDISFVRGGPEGWSAPASVHADGWTIRGCPVNGPAVSVAAQGIAVAWYTESDRTPRVLAALSEDGGRSFRPPVRVDRGNPAGRVDIEWLPEGGALVSWIERGEGPSSAAALLTRVVAFEEAPEPPLVIAETSAIRASGFPRMAAARGDVFLAWTDASDPPRIRVGRLPRIPRGPR